MANDIFDVSMQDRVWKQQFFYNAFRALAFNRIDGDYAEFGCWSGSSFWLAHLESRRHGHNAHLWAFDSFQGLRQGGIPTSAYGVVPGFYHDTLDQMSAGDAPVNIALAFIDCDMYSSTKSVLRFLMPRLKHGMIIAFDDYFCWSATQVSGERRAMLEAFGRNEKWQLLPYMQFGYHGQSFVVEDKLILGEAAGLQTTLP